MLQNLNFVYLIAKGALKKKAGGNLKDFEPENGIC